MSQFQVADEAVVAMWDGLVRDLYELAPSRQAARAFLKVARRDFYYMLMNFPEDVFARVTRPAPGTGKPVLALAISDGFRGHATLAAKRFYGLSSH